MNKTGDPSRILGDIIYTSRPHAYTHPQNLYLMGSLFGLNPPDFRTARILELGCAGGGNILPIALDYPEARIAGFDIAANHIEEANRHKSALGLDNIVFETRDVAAIGPAGGEFDYIIAHGLLSWVPQNIRGHIFRICRENLSPHGLAYISYNAMPGWEALLPIRDELIALVGGIGDPVKRFHQARQFINDSLKAATPGMRAAALETVKAAFAGDDPSYALYEYTGAINTPFFIQEAVAMAQATGLQYVGETLLSEMHISDSSPAEAARLAGIRDFTARMQKLDFMTNRRFHRSIFARAELPIQRNISLDVLFRHYIIPAFERDGTAFRGTRWKDLFFSADDPFTADLFAALAANREKTVRLDDIIASLGEQAKQPEVKKRAVEKVFGLLLRDLVFITAEPDRHTEVLSERPLAYRLARYQAGLPDCAWVTSCRHVAVQMPDKLAVFILQHLDGTKTMADLINLSFGRFKDNLENHADPRAVLDKEVPVIVEKIINRHLLVA